MFQAIVNIFVFLATIGLIIFFHELGHFMAAKLCKVKVEEFALGFKPTIFKWKKNETNYMINLIPLGGYVKLLGEDSDSSDIRSFSNQSPLKKIFVLISGVIMNFILAIILFVIGYSIGMAPIINNFYKEVNYEITPNYIVKKVQDNSLAKKVDIRVNDIITGLEFERIIRHPNIYKNKKITLAINRNHQSVIKDIVLTDKNNILGIEFIEIGLLKLKPISAVYRAIRETKDTIVYISVAMCKLFTDLIKGKNVSSEIAGPIGIYSITLKSFNLGLPYLIRLIIILTINIGLINILPIPALDGGRIFFLTINTVTRNKIIKPELENYIHYIGLILLLMLMLVVTFIDIKKIFLC